MAEGIVYLDVDDEITSAAQRIRSAAGARIALVVPHGSRIATSRMNFRLLAREATISSKRLSIVSNDAASRSLAASAGLPVFGSVGEYDTSLRRGSDGPAPQHDEPDAPRQRRTPAPPAAAAGLAASATVAAASTEDDDANLADDGDDGDDTDDPEPLESSATVVMPAPARKSQRPRRPEPAVTSVPARGGSPTATAATVGSGVAATGPFGAPAGVRSRGADPYGRPIARRDRDTVREADDEDEARRRRSRTPILVVLGVVGLAAVVLAVGAYLLLPSASISLTPRQEPIGPIQLSVAADPAATEVDPARAIVPAVRLDVPVSASQTFTTTGKRVKEAPARGEVTFSNYDFTAQNTIVSGSVVSTEGGIRFRTLATVILPPATFVIPTSVPSRRSVAIEAVKDGPEGNVAANSIRSVPQGENPAFLRVTNAAPTDGGTRTETPEISAEEVEDAVATVTTDLGVAWDQAIADGAGAPEDTTLFPETAVLGPPVPTVDPAQLVGRAEETFDLELTATGSVVAVDPRPVRTIAEGQLADEIGADHRLVPGSVDIEVGEGTVGEDGQITFLATARAARVRTVDPATLRPLVINRSAADARAALAPYGDAVVTLWPDWVTTVTGVDSRLTITVEDDGSAGAGPSPSPAGSSTPRASRPPSIPPTRPPSPAPAADSPTP